MRKTDYFLWPKIITQSLKFKILKGRVLKGFLLLVYHICLIVIKTMISKDKSLNRFFFFKKK